MKTTSLLITLLLSFTSSLAFADGFRCEAKNTGLMLEVYNHENPSEGTRTPASLVVFDPASIHTNTMIAAFTDRNHTLAYVGKGLYRGKVDLRFADTSTRNAVIAGTTLAQLDHLDLDISFSYARDAASLARITKEIPGKVSYVKRTGEVIQEDVTCSRYLKN